MQAANDTKVSSVSNLIDRLLVFAAVMLGFALHITDFRYYVVFFAAGIWSAALYCCYRAREVLFSKEKVNGSVFAEIKESMKAGLPLMISSLSALMITGVSRQIIDMRWEIDQFSKISLSLTMMNMVLVFLNQSSLVLFPAIRKINQSSQTELYSTLNRLINIVVPVVLVLYVPIGTVINYWLPEYRESIQFLGILLPMCIWDGKMNLLNNTYYKVLRMERQLLIINIGTFVLNMICSIAGAYAFGNVNMIAYGLLLSITFRSLVSEALLHKKLGKKFDKSVCIPIIGSILYIMFNNVLSGVWASAAYTAFYMVVFVLTRHTLKESFDGLKHVIKKQM